jgi:two-component system NtrC family response regulator
MLQGCAIGRVGEGESEASTARVIAASSADLQDAAKTGQFLEDLYYSLAVVVIQLPPLRERKKDIRPLARSLLRQFANQHRKPALKFEADALQALERYPWPGNLRELENCLRRSVILADGDQLRAEHLGLASLPPRLRALHGLKAARRDAERDMIVQALRQHGGKVSAAAAELGVSRPTLYALLRKLRIDRSGASLNEP